jgi:uncharacterized protein YndB with AHSA1/START domain
MHVITVTRRTTAKPEAIWRLWADVPNRTRWDNSLERITLQGPFQPGAAGIVKLRGQPERKFKVVDTVPPRAYTDRFFLPLGGKMDWAHSISDVDGERSVTFNISITGPTSPLLAPMLKRILRRELPSTLSKLIALAEQT